MKRRLSLLVLIGLLLAGGGLAWWKLRQPAPEIPPVPADIQEPDVVRHLEKHRAEIVANPRSGEAWGLYAMALLAHLFDRDADRCFEQAANLAPEDPRWPYSRAQIALKRDPPKAVPLLQQAIATTGQGAEYRSAARLTLAETHLERGELDEAAALFNEELGPPPGEPRAVFGLGFVAIARNDEPTATRLLSTLLDTPFAKKQARVQLARLAWQRGDQVAARRFERQAATIPDDPAWPDPLLDRTAQMAVGRRGRDRRIDIMERNGDYHDAVQAYLLELEGERTPKLLLGAAANYIRLRDYNKALPLAREATERDAKSPQAHYTLCLAYFNPAERAIDADPASEQAKAWFREATEHAKRTTELKPDHARAYLHWGLSLKFLGDPKGAIEPFRKGLIARPDEFELHLGLGQVLAMTGDRVEAEKCFENARRLDPDDPRPARELEKLKAKKE